MGLAKSKVKILSSFKILKFNIHNEEYEYKMKNVLNFWMNLNKSFNYIIGMLNYIMKLNMNRILSS